jgi:hypothetical protein
MKRTKSFSSYINSLNSDINNLKSINDSASLSAGAITGTSFSEDVTLFGSSIKSSDYVGGESGWKIDSTGVAEFSDVYVRGDINAQTGTIGYWNISSPGVIRRIGPDTQFGTFLESENVGPTDDSKTSGVYVGLFKSYFEDPLPLSNIRRLSNVATITVLDSGYEAGDRVIVDVAEDDTYNNGGLPVTIIASTGDTFSYINTGSDFPASGTLDTTSTAATGTVTFYNPDIAGLYIKDYGKADIDYGYFSSAGLAFVSGSRVNLVHNPSFEFVKSVDVTAISGSGTTITYSTATDSGFVATKTVTIVGAETGAYNLVNAEIATANTINFRVTSTATGESSTAVATSKVSSASSWNYVAATTAAIPTIDFSTLVNNYLTASEYGGLVSWSNTMSSSYRVEGVVAYNKGLTYNLFSNERVLALSYDSFVDYKPFTAVATAMFATAGNTSQMTISTSGAHGLSTGDLVYCDFIASLPAEDWEFGPGVLTVTDILSSTQFRVVNPNGTLQPSFTMTPAAIDGRSTSVYHAINPAIPLDQISFKLPNGVSVPVANVLNAVTTASWVTANNKYIAQGVEVWISEYLSPASGIQPLKPVSKAPIYIDAEKLRLAYASLDATNFANAANITLSIPAAIYQQVRNVSTYTTSNIAYMTSVVTATAISGNGTTVTVTAPNNYAVGDTVTITGASTAAYNTIINVAIATASSSQFQVLSSATGTTSAATATAYRPVRQILDSVSLSTEAVAFYGDSSSDYAWEDPELNTAAQISIQDPKKWVDIDLATQAGYFSNLDYISLKQSRLNEPMLVQPGIEADADYSYDIGHTFEADYNYETLKLSSGIISVYDGTNYLEYESRQNLAASKTKSVSQIIASFKSSANNEEAGENYDVSSSITLQAGIGLTPSITFNASSIFAADNATLHVDEIQSASKSYFYGFAPNFPEGLRTGASSFTNINGLSFNVYAPSGFTDAVSFGGETYFNNDSYWEADDIILGADTNILPTNSGDEGIRLVGSGTSSFGMFARDHSVTVNAALFVGKIAYTGTSATNLVDFRVNGTQVGTIQASGTGGATVSYNNFMGSHYTEFEGPAPLLGTVMETVDELVEVKYAGQNRLPKTKVSDTPGSKSVYGVYFSEDADEDTQAGHMIAALGASWIRVASGVTVSSGDLLESNGDGCARVQSDDVIRSSTIGKVSSSIAVETYEDGSYLVPCVLYCG